MDENKGVINLSNSNIKLLNQIEALKKENSELKRKLETSGIVEKKHYSPQGS